MNKTAAILIFFIVLAVNVFTMAPGLTEDDSGELAGGCVTLGIAHSPGYPVYCMAGKILNTAVPFGGGVYRANLVSAVFIALSAAAVFAAALAVSGSLPGAVFCSLLFAFSKPVWGMGVSTEVYGLSAFLAGLVVLFLLKDAKYLWLIVFFIWGLGIAAHYTLGLMGLGIAWWFLFSQDRYKNPGSFALDSLKAAMFFLLGLSVLWYIYVRAQSNPVFGWEDPKTLERFWQVIARLRYGSIALAQGGGTPLAPDVIYSKLAFYVTTLSAHITWFGIAVFALGAWVSFKEKIKGIVLLLLFLGTGPGFLLLANVKIGPGSAELLERFFYLSYLFLAVTAAYAFRKIPKPAAYALLLVPVYMFYSGVSAMDRRQEFVFYDCAKNILRSVPQGSVLFFDRADEMEFCAGYLRLAEGKRSDLRFIDCNAGITRSIYGDDYYKIWGPPRLRLRERTEKAIIAESLSPVYYASFLNENLNVPRFQEGLVFRAKPAVSARPGFAFDEIYVLRYPLDVVNSDKRVLNAANTHLGLMSHYLANISRYDDAEFYVKGMEAFERSGAGIVNLGFIYHRKGELDRAKACYEKAIERGIAKDDVLVNLGAIYEAKGMAKESENMYIAAAELNDNNTQAHYNLASLYWKQSRWSEVVREFEKVLSLSPGNEQARRYLETARSRVK